MYDFIYKLIENISNFMYSYLLIVLLLGVGLYFTFRTKFVQFRLFGESVRLIKEKKTDGGKVSAFEALMVSTASRVGTGNIVGVANAIAIGGYGAVFWMWVTAIIGSASAFIESTLAQVYKKRDKEGGSYGGPAYYIEAAMKSRWLGIVFAVALIATYAVGFNMLCSFNFVTSLSEYSFYGDPATSKVPLICGIALAVLVGFCLFGGGKRVIKVTSFMVPVMGTLYIAMALLAMILNIENLPHVFKMIFSEAFNFRAIFGGLAGSALMQGIKRGLYSNEAGVGSAPNASAAADVSHPVKQGLVQTVSVFIDTLLVCTATAMMCLSSGLEPTEALSGAPFVQKALSASFGAFGSYFITISLLLFAFTTLLGNLFYCEGAMNYIAKRQVGKKTMNVFNVFACLVIGAGALLEFGMVWNVADVLMGIMTLINLPILLILSRTAMKTLSDYQKQRKAGKDPVFKASSIGLKQKTDFWN